MKAGDWPTEGNIMFDIVSVFVQDTAFQFNQLSEDGEPQVGHSYSVVVQAADGRREARFVGATQLSDGSDGFPYPDRSSESEAEDQAHKLADKLRCILETHQPRLNPSKWSPIDPAYGSQAYQEGDFEWINAQRERQDDLQRLYR